MGTIRNRTVMKVHSIFKTLRDVSSKFFQQKDQSLIRFSFSETAAYIQFTVKFANTHKRLKFIVAKDSDEGSLEYVMYEKTKNIILDIDKLYRERERGWLKETPSLKRELLPLFFWGITFNENRKDEVFRCDAVQLPQKSLTEDLREDVLYYGMITKIDHLENIKLNNGAACSTTLNLQHLRLTLLHKDSEGKPVTFDLAAAEDIVGLFRVNKLLIMNWMGRVTSMSFMNSKHHLNYTSSQVKEIEDYLTAQRKETRNDE